jgi:hypothetical protein
MKLLKYLAFILFTTFAFSQEIDDFAKRLKAINNQTIIFYNVDGVNFSSQTFSYQFNKKGLKKLYRKFSINDDDLKVRDESLTNNNFFITKSEKITDSLNQINSYYFVENQNKTVSIFWFGYFDKLNKEFERKFVNLILEDKIPKEVFEPMSISSIDFAGRKIKLGSDCYWTNVNIVQCPYNGEMNWSIHKTIESAKKSIENQFTVTKSQKGGKIVSETEVDVIFENTETKAKKVIYDFTGVKSLLAGMSGGKTLTIYYVASNVRENYVSCCMSYWNNDNITENGLSPLLEEVMKLKK